VIPSESGHDAADRGSVPAGSHTDRDRPPAVVLISGTDAAGEVEAASAGAVGYLRKARGLAELIDVIALLGTSIVQSNWV
jgi:DNA-binding response OmpR family regulator